MAPTPPVRPHFTPREVAFVSAVVVDPAAKGTPKAAVERRVIEGYGRFLSSELGRRILKEFVGTPSGRPGPPILVEMSWQKGFADGAAETGTHTIFGYRSIRRINIDRLTV
jgi:hypothetical protein